MLVLEGNDCIQYSGKLYQLVEKRIYVEKSFTACSVTKDASPYNFVEKISRIAINPQNSQKFLPSNVSRYILPSCVTEREITV